MLLRAVFWIAVVSVFMPREPDLGFGAPGPHALGSLAEWIGTPDPNMSCKDAAAPCSAALGLLDSFQSVTVRSLAQVKADIEEQERARARKTFAER
jgi:hypothetical protein